MIWANTMERAMRYVESYVHMSQVGVLAELETDDALVTTTDEFRRLARDLVLHIATCKPASIDGLLGQPFIKNPSAAVSDRIQEVAEHLDAPIRVRRFVWYDVRDA